jgi:RimJ/RimL family protein N-acetyltransferase
MTAGLRWPLSVPVLSDGVVALRAHTPADIDAVFEMATDPEMVRWTSIPTPYSREMAEEFALSIIPKGWDDGDKYGWAIDAADDQGRWRYAGNVDVRGVPIAHLGFSLHPWARGRGLMVRAVRLATDWAFTHGTVEVVHWRSQPGNVASLRVAHRTGFTLNGLVPGALHERGRVLDAWTASRRFGEAPIPLVGWAESPVIESERLRLRPYRESDIPRNVEACSDEVTRRWITDLPSPYTEAEARRYLDEVVWKAATGTTATWAVADRASDELLGQVAVMDLRGSNPTGGEIGYWMHPDARGRGLMTEAVRAVTAHAFDRAGLDRRRLVIHAAAGNAASNAVAVAAGFRHFGTQTAAERLPDGTFDDLRGYERLNSTWGEEGVGTAH